MECDLFGKGEPEQMLPESCTSSVGQAVTSWEGARMGQTDCLV
jgi:hypothetical protein